MRTLWNKIYAFFALRSLTFLKILPIVLILSGCGNDDTSSGEEANYNEQARCWQTSIINTVTGQLDALFSDGKKILGADGAVVLLVGFSIWLALKLLKLVASFKEENLGEVITEITQKLFLCAFCFYFAANSGAKVNEAVNKFVAPVYATVIDLGISALGPDGDGSEAMSLDEYGEAKYTHQAIPCPTNFTLASNNLEGSIQPISNCLICRINSRLNSGNKIAMRLIGSGEIGAILLGLALLVLFWITKVGFVLYVVDGLFRLNFAAYLLPTLILGIPFAYTRKWSKHVFLMFMNSAGIMMFMGLLIGIAIGSMEKIIKGLEFTDAGINGVGHPLLSIFLIALIFFKIPGLAVALADKFIGGGGGLSFQKKISKFIVSMAKKAGAEVFNKVTSGAANLINTQLQKYEKTREMTDSIKNINSTVSNAINSLAGYNDD